MNMLTTIQPPSPAPVRPLAMPELMQRVERAMLMANVSPSAFSRAIVGNTHLLRDIKDGKVPLPRTQRRMQAHAVALIEHARQVALKVLVIGAEGVSALDIVDDVIDVLDRAVGDPDIEPGGDADACSARDDDPTCKDMDALNNPDHELTYPEWHTRGRHKLDRHGAEPMGSADDDDTELNGDEQDHTEAEDENGFRLRTDGGPGCIVSDTDFCLAGDDRIVSGSVVRGQIDLYYQSRDPLYFTRDIGDEGDAEREQMIGDVPTVAVFAIEPSPFTGKRALLGYSNLLTSFQGNGRMLVSADSGRAMPRGRFEGVGAPV